MLKFIGSFVFEGELPSMNEIIAQSKKHWSKYSKVKKVWTGEVEFQTKLQRKPLIDEQVYVRFIWYTKDERKDPDNVRAGSKYLLDGIVRGGILEDDGRKQIAGFIDQYVTDKDWQGCVVLFYRQTEPETEEYWTKIRESAQARGKKAG